MSESPPRHTPDPETIREILDAYFAHRDLEEAIDSSGADLTPVDVYRYIERHEHARSYFDRLALADRGLRDAETADGGDGRIDPPPADFERGFGDAVFDDVLDAALEGADDGGRSPDAPNVEDASGGATVSPWDGGRRSAAVLAAAAVAALVAGTVVWNWNRAPSNRDQFRARSTATHAETEPTTPRLELFCARRDGGEVTFRGAGDTPADVPECRLRDELKLAYDNPGSQWEYAAFFGVDAGGDVYWYGPSPASDSPPRIETRTDSLQPFGETIRLRVNHTAGRLRVYGLFSTQPIDFERLRSLVRTEGAKELYGRRHVELQGVPSTSTSRMLRIVREKRR